MKFVSVVTLYCVEIKGGTKVHKLWTKQSVEVEMSGIEQGLCSSDGAGFPDGTGTGVKVFKVHFRGS